MICAKFDFNWPHGCGEEDFKFVNVFSLFCNHLPLEIGAALHLNKLESPLHPRMLCAKFGWNWPGGSREDDFSNLLMYFRNFIIIFPLWTIGPSFEQSRIPLHPKIICAKFHLNWPTGFGEENFKICQCFFPILQLSPLGKRRGPSFEQTWIPSTQRWLCQF